MTANGWQEESGILLQKLILLMYFTHFRHFFRKHYLTILKYSTKGSFLKNKTRKKKVEQWQHISNWSKVVSSDFLSNNWNNAYKENRFKGRTDRDRRAYQYTQVR